MTDRYHALTVVLEDDIRDDDAEELMSAIRCLRGVAHVTGNVSDTSTYAATVRARLALKKKLYAALELP